MNPNQSTLAGDIYVVPITITATAQSLSDLVITNIPTYVKSNIMQMSLLAKQPSSSTDRGAVLFGHSVDQIGYLSAGEERTWPVRGDRVFVKRAGASDVSAAVEVYLTKQP